MRRFVSMSAILAMAASLFSPLLAQAQDMDMTHPMACHRSAKTQVVHKHHCAGMAEAAAQPVARDTINPGDGPQQCPMNCCTQSNPQTGTALLLNSLSAPLAMSGTTVQFTSLIFASDGFSSHTDRGPPAA
jgi:predicted cobalt transporter CbtA